MAEPTSTAVAAATLVAAGVSVPFLTAFGVPLGLRIDILIAGFAGSLVAIILLNTVPASDETLVGLLRATVKRMAFVLASSLTAGYLTPLTLMVSNIPDPLFLCAAFAVGGGAQKVLVWSIQRITGNNASKDDKP